MERATLAKFFEWLMQHYDAAHVVRLRREWECLTFRQVGQVMRVPSPLWPQLWDEYDERMAIMTEGRQPNDADPAKAWESVMKNKEYGGPYEKDNK